MVQPAQWLIQHCAGRLQMASRCLQMVLGRGRPNFVFVFGPKIGDFLFFGFYFSAENHSYIFGFILFFGLNVPEKTTVIRRELKDGPTVEIGLLLTGGSSLNGAMVEAAG